LFVNFNIYASKEDFQLVKSIYKVFPVFHGGYTDFSSNWYTMVGASLAVTLTINIISPHFSKIIEVIWYSCKRSYDKKNSNLLKYKPTDDNDFSVNTR
jgi:hypothetical protein